MMRKYRKIRFSMLFYFILFSVITVACVWILQLVFLEGYYQNERVETMKKCATALKDSANGDDFAKNESLSKDSGVSVYLYDENKQVIYPDDVALTETENSIIVNTINDFLKNSEKEHFEISISGLKRERFAFVLVSRYNGDYLVLSSSGEKIVETLGVVRLQLALVTVIVLIIGIILAWYLSNKLSKPIDEISETAKKWADGDNSVTFNTTSNYYEMRELTDTLNFAKDGVSKSEILQRDLLANVSHDLKTPLTMIKAYAEMIKDISGENKSKREAHTQVIIDEADRLTMLVNDILNLAKLQSKVDAPEMKELNLSELTERVIARFEPYVETQGYKIENHVAPDLITMADEKKIEQVVYNLLGNSINYTGEDKTVKVYLSAKNDKILLEIIDSGKGITEENVEGIWERYYRFSETNTRPVKGTGLGLSIVKTILDAHNLKYGVRSKKDFGSNFYVEFERVKNE